MKVISIKNNKKVVWDIRSSVWPMKSEITCRSKIQYTIGQLIKEKYPLDTILEDITIPDTRLSLDFYLPQRSLAIEIQGGQHNEFNPYFHNNKEDFDAQKIRDEAKVLFCELNGIKLLAFNSEKEAKEYFNVK